MTAVQNSTFRSSFLAGFAIDRNRDTDVNGMSCMHTIREPNPWWKVSFDIAVVVRSVQILNRGDNFHIPMTQSEP